MHESELHEYSVCAACGVDVSPAERGFAFGDDDMLCYACALERRGTYDELHDRWTSEPEIEDLLREFG